MWDDKVPNDVQQKWKAWTNSLSKITKYPISRRLTKKACLVVFRSLHSFADASSIAYGAAVYLCNVHQDTTISVSLVTAKARVSPLKSITIPRAELVAAYLLAKLNVHVMTS